MNYAAIFWFVVAVLVTAVVFYGSIIAIAIGHAKNTGMGCLTAFCGIFAVAGFVCIDVWIANQIG